MKKDDDFDFGKPDPVIGRILRAKCRTCKHPILNHLPENRKPGEPTKDDEQCRCSNEKCQCIVRWRYVVDSLRKS